MDDAVVPVAVVAVVAGMVEVALVPELPGLDEILGANKR